MKFHQVLIICIAVLTLCFLTQCQSKKSSIDTASPEIEDDYSYSGLYCRLQAIYNDTTLCASDLKVVIAPFLDTLVLLSEDQHNLRSRLAAQQLAYYSVDMLYDRFINENTDDSDMKALDAMTAPLLEAIGKWFYDVEDGIPVLWHDMFFLSNKESDNPINGYYHIMVLLPTEDKSEAELDVFFPDNAESLPYIAFTKFLGADIVDEDWNNLVTVPFDNWYKRDELEEGYPLYGVAGKDVVDMMLQYDVMYLSFSNSPDSELGDKYETARLSLYYFKQKYQEYIATLSK